MNDPNDLLTRLSSLIAAAGDACALLQTVCDTVKSELDGYDWVGFYLVDPNAERELILGPYAGAPTDHTRIPFGRGICGQAAESGEIFVIDDVNAQGNYLACSVDVKSEIVVPIFDGDRMTGQLDIDSHAASAFGPQDRAFCEALSEKLGKLCAEAAVAG